VCVCGLTVLLQASLIEQELEQELEEALENV
jgi:hypothetical protein